MSKNKNPPAHSREPSESEEPVRLLADKLTRNEIRDSAARFFLNQCLGASLEEFQQHCGITPENFSEYFGSKDEVIGNAICAANARLQHRLETLIDLIELNGVPALRQVAAEICRALYHTDLPDGLGSEALAYYPDDHPMHETARLCKGILFPLVEELCHQARLADPTSAAWQLLATAEGFYTLRHLLGSAKSLELAIQATDSLIEAFPKKNGGQSE